MDNTQQFNWDKVWDAAFNKGKEFLMAELSGANINENLVLEHCEPFLKSLYGLKPYIWDDSSKSDVISPATKQYVLKTIIPSLNSSIDSYWNSLGYAKKTTFKLLARNNKQKITGKIGSCMNSLTYGFIGGLKFGGRLSYVLDDLNSFMGGPESPVTISAAHKIQSLS